MPPLVRHAPPRSACFQPNNYTNLGLFANRHDQLEDLVGTLESYLDPDGPGEAYLLLRGTRGIGKSMLARMALAKVKTALALLVIEVDCAASGTGVEAVLRSIARSLAREVTEHALDDELRKHASLFDRMARATKLKSRDVATWSSQMKLSLNAAYKFYDLAAFEFGMTRTAGRSREVEESYERAVDAAFLLELIRAFLVDCHAAGEKVLVFVDNLDQAGYQERREDVQAIMDLARYLFSLQSCVVLATLRSEFVARDLHKIHSLSIDVPGMSSDELMEVADKRMQSAGKRQQEALADVSFRRVAERASRWTDNAWGFLSWLEYLDQRSIDLSAATDAEIRDALFPAAQSLYPDLRRDELTALARAFQRDKADFLTVAELATLGVSRLISDRAVRDHALIPDFVIDTQRYTLPPQLHFLVEEG